LGSGVGVMNLVGSWKVPLRPEIVGWSPPSPPLATHKKEFATFGAQVWFRVQGWLHVHPVLTALPHFLAQPSIGAAHAVGRTALPSLLMLDLQFNGAPASCCPKPVPSLQQCPSRSHVVHLVRCPPASIPSCHHLRLCESRGL
jgi:hypothetical protein